MAPIDGDLNITKDNVQEVLQRQEFKDLTKEELQLLLDTKTGVNCKEVTKQSLLNKPNMTPTDKENMQKVITYLEEYNSDTWKNLRKLNEVEYGIDFIKVWPTKFSREKLIPQVTFKQTPNQYDVFESNIEWVFKTLYNEKEEYYLTSDSYIDEVRKQGRKPIVDDTIEGALQSLPGEFSSNKWYHWANILWDILNLSMSGYINSDGILLNKYKYWYLNTASPLTYGNSTWRFKFNNDRGGLHGEFVRYYAHPCLFIIE